EYLNWMNPPFISVDEYLNWMNPPFISVNEYLILANKKLSKFSALLRLCVKLKTLLTAFPSSE
ncbi:hypothetical protein, partial [Nostoc sp.]|uniref:hypothetical protein n=1 Tax=Nostoc sp. TaxID=1180 RepID=UPI002FF4F1BF